MYSIDIIKSSINLYFKLKKDNIIGKKRINYIKQTFNVHINTLYNWITTYYNVDNNTFNFDGYKTKFKYNNKKINYDIETFIINSIDSNNNFNIKNIKNNITKKFNVKLSKTTIYHILHKHNLTYKNIIKTYTTKVYSHLGPSIFPISSHCAYFQKNNFFNIIQYCNSIIF